jgi:phosphoribosylglycinamide formyltransferase 1
MRNIAIFASGSGTNAENIIKFFSNNKTAGVSLVLSNKREAYVLKRAATLNVRSVFFDRKELYEKDKVLRYLSMYKIDFIVLAGFLWLIPENILDMYDKRIVNIHPALLPRYGGKGMYGDVVHEAVIANHDKESGITIHYVNRAYDKGETIFQTRCKIDPADTPATLAAKVHALEYKYFPVVIEELVAKLPDMV